MIDISQLVSYSAHITINNLLGQAIGLIEFCEQNNICRADIYNNLSILFKRHGDTEKAIQLLKTAVSWQPDYGDAWSNLGNALILQGRNDEAVESLSKAVEINPVNSAYKCNLARAFASCRKYNEAIAVYQSLIGQGQASIQAITGLGVCFLEQSDYKHARDIFRRLLTVDGSDYSTHLRMGICEQQLDNPRSAKYHYARSYKINKNSAQSVYNLGTVYHSLGEYDNAIKFYTKALEADSNYIDARYSRSCLMLMHGNFGDGWKEYESRLSHGSVHCQLECEMWDGSDLGATQRLYIVSEQGLGDSLQFVRFIEPLQARHSLISLAVPYKLHRVISDSFPYLSLVSPEEAKIHANEEDRWLPMLSLPKVLGLAEWYPVDTSYLSARKSGISEWKALLGSHNDHLIGIHWQGNPDQENSPLTKGRSIPLEEFRPLAEIKEATFVSLQKGHGIEQRDDCCFKEKFVSCQDEIDDRLGFDDMAALIMCCSLVITNDTAVAHLSAGLGQKTWLLLKKIPDWRWRATGSTTGWYPSMRLFRQAHQGDWSTVMKEVQRELKKEIRKLIV